MEKTLNELKKDSARLDYLEDEAYREPIVLHAKNELECSYRGLGLSNIKRTLRQAIDSLILTDARHQSGMQESTWEQRQGYRDRNGARIEECAGVGMTAAELIKLMGPSHVSHPQFEARPRSLLPMTMPNLAGLQPTVSAFKATFWAEFKRAFRWSA